jgi:hypothetical protein
MNQSYVAKLIRGDGSASVEQQAAFAGALSLPVDEIFAPQSLSLAEAVTAAGTSVQTLQRAVEQGEITVAHRGPGGVYEISEGDLTAWDAARRCRVLVECSLCQRWFTCRGSRSHLTDRCWHCRTFGAAPDCLIELPDVALRLKRVKQSIQQLARAHRIGGKTARGRGGPAHARWVFSSDEVEELERVLAGSGYAKLWREGRGGVIDVMNRSYRPWSGSARQRHQGWNGPKGAAAGIEAGRAKGGRPALLTPDQQLQILRLDKAGHSSREIAEIVFGDGRLKDRVLRFLRR